MSNTNANATPPPEGGDVINNVVGTPPVLPQGVAPVTQGGGAGGASTSHQAHGDGVETSIVRMMSLMMQDQPVSLDAHHYQGITFEPLSISLFYLLTIHRVLATLGKYPNLMEPTIPSGRTQWRSI
jgi:hypothetical protein